MTDTSDQIQERDYGFDTLALHAGQEVDPFALLNLAPPKRARARKADRTRTCR